LVPAAEDAMSEAGIEDREKNSLLSPDYGYQLRFDEIGLNDSYFTFYWL
jgi:hypothetical protein